MYSQPATPTLRGYGQTMLKAEEERVRKEKEVDVDAPLHTVDLN
jgi:hypothetical protein